MYMYAVINIMNLVGLRVCVSSGTISIYCQTGSQQFAGVMLLHRLNYRSILSIAGHNSSTQGPQPAIEARVIMQ